MCRWLYSYINVLYIDSYTINIIFIHWKVVYNYICYKILRPLKMCRKLSQITYLCGKLKYLYLTTNNLKIHFFKRFIYFYLKAKITLHIERFSIKWFLPQMTLWAQFKPCWTHTRTMASTQGFMIIELTMPADRLAAEAKPQAWQQST